MPWLGVRAAALAGLGVALLPEFVVEAELADRTLRRLLPEVEIADIRCHAIYRVEARHSARVEAVVSHLRRTL